MSPSASTEFTPIIWTQLLDQNMGLFQLSKEAGGSFLYYLLFMLLNLTVFVYFFLKQRQRKHIFKYALFPLLGLLIVGYVWAGFDKTTLIFGFSWLAIGVVVGAPLAIFLSRGWSR